MKVEVETGFYSVEMCRENPKKLFIFGDNWDGVGKGGQAMIRDEPNTFGISTKYSCMYSFSDDRFRDNMESIKMDTDTLLDIADLYDAIVFPARGLGTGLAALQSLAPKTFLHLSGVLLSKFGFNNLAYLEPIN